MEYIEWLNIWLNNYIKPSAKERTYIRYEQLIRTHIAKKSRRKRRKRPYAYRFAIVCNGIIKLRQFENRQRVIGKLCKYGHIRYSKLIENGAFSRHRKRICCEQNKTPQDKGKAS